MHLRNTERVGSDVEHVEEADASGLELLVSRFSFPLSLEIVTMEVDLKSLPNYSSEKEKLPPTAHIKCQSALFCRREQHEEGVHTVQFNHTWMFALHGVTCSTFCCRRRL